MKGFVKFIGVLAILFFVLAIVSAIARPYYEVTQMAKNICAEEYGAIGVITGTDGFQCVRDYIVVATYACEWEHGEIECYQNGGEI